MITEAIIPPVHLRHMCLANKEAMMKAGGGQKIKFVNPNIDNYPKNIENAARLHREGMECYEKDSLPEGTVAVVVGSGPTLKTDEALDALREAGD